MTNKKLPKTHTEFPKKKMIRLRSLSFHYRDWGGEGQSFILLHGLASNCRIWDLIAPILSKDYAVIAIDQRGHGRSDKPDEGYDFKSVGEDLAQFIKVMKLKRPIVVGHSWGGSVAISAAVAHPGIIGGLCLVDGGLIEISRTPGNTLELALQHMAPPVWTGITETSFRQRMKNRDWGERDRTSQAASLSEIVFANLVVSNDGLVSARLSRANHLKIVRAFWEHKPSTFFHKVKCPTFLLPARGKNHDRQRDKIREEMVRLAQGNIPTCETIWLENSIHDVPLQRPELVARLIKEQVKKGFFNSP